MLSVSTIKSTGATFTPPDLAKFIARSIISKLNFGGDAKVIKVLDPSCGDGSLLEAFRIESNLVDIKVELFGYDINSEYLLEAKKNIGQLATLVEKDFLLSDQNDLFHQTSNKDDSCFYDVIIANPPYVRTQVLGAEYSKKLANQYNLKGKIDLYHAFIIEMTKRLKENGVVGLITSNKFISNKSGAGIRCFLTKNFNIEHVYDLGDTKFFDAAVLPAIVIGSKVKSPENKNAYFSKIYQLHVNNYNDSKVINIDSKIEMVDNSKSGIYKFEEDFFEKTDGQLKFIKNKACNWSLLTLEEKAWIDKVESKSPYTVKDFFKVRVGIKSTADKIFIKDNWDEMHPEVENELLFDLISQENIDSYTTSERVQLKVLYPYDRTKVKKTLIKIENYPGAKRYLEENRERLTSRKYLIDAGRKWYELWVPQIPALWNFPKLVFPDISDRPRFCIDTSGKIVNGNCYWITANNDIEIDCLYLIQGIANSHVMTKYHDLVFMNKLYSGRRRYMTQYIERYPLPDIDSTFSRKVIELSKKISSPNSNKNDEIKSQLEECIENYYLNC